MPKTKLPKLDKKTIKELRAVMADIKKEPRRLNMHDWIMLFNPEDPEYKEAVAKREGPHEGENDSMVLSVPPCGTQGCIAGWVRLRNDPRIAELKRDATVTGQGLHYDNYDAADYAQGFLNLTSEQAERLFYFKSFGRENGWPKRFESAYLRAKTPRGRANATIRRTEHFIATNGAE